MRHVKLTLFFQPPTSEISGARRPARVTVSGRTRKALELRTSRSSTPACARGLAAAHPLSGSGGRHLRLGYHAARAWAAAASAGCDGARLQPSCLQSHQSQAAAICGVVDLAWFGSPVVAVSPDAEGFRWPNLIDGHLATWPPELGHLKKFGQVKMLFLKGLFFQVARWPKNRRRARALAT